MNKSTLISVIVPVYNVEKYVAKCIDSILLQTFKNFELLLIDDGSLDNSGRICDEYLPKDKRIKVFHKDNGGLSDARNFGFSKSIGEYICFIDSDDYVTSDYLEHLYNLIIEHNADIACADYKTVEENQSTFEQDNLLKNYEINKIDNTIQYNTIQYNTIQYNTIQYNTFIKNFINRKKIPTYSSLE